jgi:hypothetical protein
LLGDREIFFRLFGPDPVGSFAAVEYPVGGGTACLFLVSARENEYSSVQEGVILPRVGDQVIEAGDASKRRE